MFARKPEPEPVESAPETSARPVAVPRPPAAESKIFQPSTFASRKAEAAGPAPRRLVSLGFQPHYLDDPSRGAKGRPQRVDVELLYDADHPSQRYYRQDPNGVLEPLQDVHGKQEQTEPLGVVDPKSWGHSGMYGDAPAETVTPVA